MLRALVKEKWENYSWKMSDSVRIVLFIKLQKFG